MAIEDLKLLKMLLPKGSLWQSFGNNFNAFLDSIAIQFQSLRKYQDDIIKESSPFTAYDTLPEWLKAYNLTKSGNTEINLKLIRLYASAYGGQSIGYFNEIIKKEYPKINVALLADDTTINVTGSIFTLEERLIFIDFCEKIFPAYCLFNFNIDVLEDYGQYGVCGILECGVGQTGAEEITFKGILR